MHRVLALVCVLCLLPLGAVAAGNPVSRRDGFLSLWQSIRRPAQSVREAGYQDVHKGNRGYAEITYAKARGILDDTDTFEPDEPLLLPDALVWLFRSRNVTAPEDIMPKTLSGLLLQYPIALLPTPSTALMPVSEEQFTSLMRSLDEILASQVHEVSLYGEMFQGKGTAFGETFDMNALTAAHRTLPYNTLVRVRNVDNGRSIMVRINDRGPYVQGRDMDLSVAAFTAIADRSLGKIHTTFERLGDVSLVGSCEQSPREQVRITRDVRLAPGLPHALALGKQIVLQANKSFVVRRIIYPDGTASTQQDWVNPGEQFRLQPSVPGEYVFWLGTVNGRIRQLHTTVWDCGGK